MEREQASGGVGADDVWDRQDSEDDFHGQQRRLLRTTFVAGASNDVSLHESPQTQERDVVEATGLPSTLDESIDTAGSDPGNEIVAPAPSSGDAAQSVDSNVDMLMAMLPYVSRAEVERALLFAPNLDVAFSMLDAGGPSGAETQTSTRSVAAIAAMGRDDHSDSGYDTDDSDEAVADTKELQSRRLDAESLLSSHGEDAADSGWYSPVHQNDVELTSFAAASGRGYGTAGDVESGGGDAAIGANSPTEGTARSAPERAMIADLIAMGFDERLAAMSAAKHPFDIDAAVQMTLTLAVSDDGVPAADPSYATPPRPPQRPGQWNRNPMHGIQRPQPRAVAANDMQLEELDAPSGAVSYQSRVRAQVRTGDQVYHKPGGVYLGHKVAITAFTLGSGKALRVETYDRTVEQRAVLELSHEEVTAAIASCRPRLLKMGTMGLIADAIVNDLLLPKLAGSGCVEFELPASAFGLNLPTGADCGTNPDSYAVDMTAASGPARVIVPSGSRKLYTTQRSFNGHEVVIQVYREGINNAVRVETTDEDGMTTTLHINDEDVVHVTESRPDLMGPSQAVKRAEFLVSRLSMVAYSYHEGVILALSSDAIPELDGTPMSASKEAGPETQNDGDGRGPDEGSGVHATRRPAAPSHSAVAGSSAFGRSNTGLSRHGLAKQPLSSLAPIAESRTPPKRQAVSSSIGTGSFSRHFDPWQDESKDKDDDDTVTGAGESKPLGPVKPYGYGSMENPIK